jgi:DNA-binding MarR family transcriptional regulator
MVASSRHGRSADTRPTPGWTLLSNHGHVLICVARDPDMLLADIATRVGIRERAAHRIITDLVDAGYLTRTKAGRRNHYSVTTDRPMRHPLERDHAIGELLDALA